MKKCKICGEEIYPDEDTEDFPSENICRSCLKSYCKVCGVLLNQEETENGICNICSENSLFGLHNEDKLEN